MLYIKRHSWIRITITFYVYYNVCVHTQWHKKYYSIIDILVKTYKHVNELMIYAILKLYFDTLLCICTL